MFPEIIVRAGGGYSVKGINHDEWGEYNPILGYCHYCGHWFVVRSYWIGDMECGGVMTTNCDWCTDYVLHPEKYYGHDDEECDEDHCCGCGKWLYFDDEKHGVDDSFMCKDCFEAELEKWQVIQTIKNMVKSEKLNNPIDKYVQTFHFNLYALDADGNEVLMTKDHIVPKSKGGEDKGINYQTMCYPCNYVKGDSVVGEENGVDIVGD